MSISIISNVAANIGSVASSAATAASDTLPLDFAALLSAQTLAPAKSASLASAASSSASGKSENTAAPAESTGKSSDEIADPSILASMLGIAQLPPPSIPIQGTGKFAPEPQEKDAPLEALSEDAKQTALMSKNPDSPTTNKEIASLTNSLKEPAQSAASLATEAANIAADSSGNTGTATNFEIVLANAGLQHEKIAPKQTTTISAPLTSATWPAQFSEKIVWLAKSDQQTAQININPPQLGPVQITLNLNGDQANAIFASPHPEVRQAIEASMPQLREMLASSGISLGDASVGANLSQQSQQPPFLAANKNQLRDENAILPANEKGTNSGSAQVLQRGRGMVDLFA